MNKIEFGDCREIMKRWIDEGVKVQTCITSPPYYGLRDYGTATWIESNDSNCDHKIGRDTRGGLSEFQKSNVGSFGDQAIRNGARCPKCNALRIDNQIGLEQSVDDYVNNMVEVFRLVKELMSDDGTLWLNLGDSYTQRTSSYTDYNDLKRSKLLGQKSREERICEYCNKQFEGKLNQRFCCAACAGVDNTPRIKKGLLKPKDLIGVPWRVAFALQADGWYLRQDIIWHKNNPMPESVTDRCTKAHEYIFLLSKKERYFFDSKAIKEQGVTPAGTKGAKGSVERQEQFGVNARPPEYKIYDGMRNKRSVWNVNTKPYKGAHFATFPTALIEPCVLAGSRKNDIVFDPFMGSGTTAQVALQHGRQYLGCELNKEYEKLQQERINNG